MEIYTFSYLGKRSEGWKESRGKSLIWRIRKGKNSLTGKSPKKRRVLAIFKFNQFVSFVSKRKHIHLSLHTHLERCHSKATSDYQANLSVLGMETFWKEKKLLTVKKFRRNGIIIMKKSNYSILDENYSLPRHKTEMKENSLKIIPRKIIPQKKFPKNNPE